MQIERVAIIVRSRHQLWRLGSLANLLVSSFKWILWVYRESASAVQEVRLSSCHRIQEVSSLLCWWCGHLISWVFFLSSISYAFIFTLFSSLCQYWYLFYYGWLPSFAGAMRTYLCSHPLKPPGLQVYYSLLPFWKCRCMRRLSSCWWQLRHQDQQPKEIRSSVPIATKLDFQQMGPSEMMMKIQKLSALALLEPRQSQYFHCLKRAGVRIKVEELYYGQMTLK